MEIENGEIIDLLNWFLVGLQAPPGNFKTAVEEIIKRSTHWRCQNHRQASQSSPKLILGFTGFRFYSTPFFKKNQGLQGLAFFVVFLTFFIIFLHFLLFFSLFYHFFVFFVILKKSDQTIYNFFSSIRQIYRMHIPHDI